MNGKNDPGGLLQSIYDHVFLPPRLPCQEDDGRWIHKLLELLLTSLNEFQADQDESSARLISKAIFAVRSFEAFRTPQGSIEEVGLGEAILRLTEEDGPIPLHVKSQNAAVLVRRDCTQVVFELFECSPSNEAAYSTSGRLRRHFPEDAVAISCISLEDVNLRDTIANTLATMSLESVAEMQSRAWKAGVEQVEERDTVRPFIVTNLFFAIIQALGGDRHQATGFWKHTREEVIWNQSSKLPWRRSPVWLLLRIALQSTLSPPAVDDGCRDSNLFKKFMIFFMSHVLNQGLQLGMECEKLEVMSVKIARRLIKLDMREAEPWILYTRTAVQKTKEILCQRWTNTIKSDNKTLDILPFRTEDLKEDVSTEIPKLDRYLESIPQRGSFNTSRFSPPTPQIVSYEPSELPKGLGFDLDGPHCIYNLSLFEDWVAKHLKPWVSLHSHDSSACRNLADILYVYTDAASQIYQDKPEGMSIMYLTALDLWVACDKCVIATHPLVAQYKPEIPQEPWVALSFRSAEHMKRLDSVERYIKGRNARATFQRSIIFDFGAPDDFAVQFFGNSAPHQALLTRIADDAERARAKKREELQALKKTYEELMTKHRSLKCTLNTITDTFGDESLVHWEHSCYKCSLARMAKQLRITAHEWPLPEDIHQAQAVVFELRLPPAFAAWRDSTVSLLRGAMGFVDTGAWPDYHCSLDIYSGLRNYREFYGSMRISLLSEVKPEENTHRRDKSINLIQEEEVCVKTGPRWSLYNNHTSRFLGPLQESMHISTVCTLQLPRSSQALQDFITRTWKNPDGVAPNLVIADQHRCPWTSSVEEFKALCSLPLGRETQWPNVLVQLAMPVIDLNNVDTLLFVWQTVEQCGLAGSTWRRVTHHRTEEARFVNACMDSLNRCLVDIKESWESRSALAVLTLVGCRLLSLCSGATTRTCLNLLAACREVSLRWLRTLRQKAFSSQDDTQRLEYARRAYEAALVCLSSFAVDNQHVAGLVNDEKTSRSYLEALITKQETEFSATHGDRPLQLHLSLRCQWVIQRFHHPVQDAIGKRGSRALHLAIEASWNGFCRLSDSGWQVTKACWLQTQLPTGSDSSSRLDVHVNILTGELLVNGLPRQRLPNEYEAHPMYKLLFGHVAFESMPSGDSGMRFVASKVFNGCQLQFRLIEKTKDLIVRARMGDETWELIPQRILTGVVPSTYNNDYVYWYNIRTSVVSLRRTNDAWSTKTDHWRLAKLSARRLAAIFEPLADILDLDITSYNQTKTAEIFLPKFQLEFFVKFDSDKIYSRQYRGMFVDGDQGIGTLTGLSTKLVLRGGNGGGGGACEEDQELPRIVLIPDGKPALSQTRLGVIPNTSLNLSDAGGRIQTYVLDRHLGQLKGNGSLKSYLFLAELHAVTSGILRDPFTGRTGTEEALKILDSAAVRSLEFVDETCQVLGRIAALAPTRTYYPEHLRQMQVVSWNPALRPSAQSDLFATLTRELVNGAELGGLFRSLPSTLNHIKENNNWGLTKRGLRRTPLNHGMEKVDVDTDLDVEYLRRAGAIPNLDERTDRAARFGRVMRSGKELILARAKFSASPDALYRFLTTTGADATYYADTTLSDLRYDPRFLRKPASVLQPRWCTLHLQLTRECDDVRPQLASWLSTLAFARDADATLLQIFLAFANVKQMSQVVLPPRDLLYQLSEGREYKSDMIQSALRNTLIQFETSAEARLPQQRNELNRELYYRRQSAFKDRTAQEVTRIAKLVQQQWSSKSPSFRGFDLSYFRTPQAIQAVESLYASWYGNLAFYRYLSSILEILVSAPGSGVEFQSTSPHRSAYHSADRRSAVHYMDLLNRIPAPSVTDDGDRMSELKVEFQETSDGGYENQLREFTRVLRARAHSSYEHSYVDGLDGSIDSLQSSNIRSAGCLKRREGFMSQLRQMKDLAETRHDDIVSDIQDVLTLKVGSSSLQSWQIASLTSNWPRCSTRHLLTLLNRNYWADVPVAWKTALLQHAVSISDVQTAERLSRAAQQQSAQDLLRELSGAVQRSWDPLKHPDSLLLEVEHNLRIRPVQEDIANAMVETLGGANATMQLNMGEGKSTVIAPRVAAWLADGTRLVRVIVAKPQARQMFDIMVTRLGGLLNRRVYQLPVSRSTSLSVSSVGIIMRNCERCMSTGGVLLAQPEHILSLQLMTVQKAIDAEKALAGSLWELHGFLESNVRDIVDESDENFSTKFELIYTMGTQRIIEHSPRRWTMIQEVLGIIMKYTRATKKTHPKGIEIDHGDHSSFPIIRFLDKSASNVVLGLAVNQICQNGLGDFPLSHESQTMRRHLLEYISIRELRRETQEQVEQSLFWETYSSNVVLLRGLFACGVLDFVFGQKRWRVNYGLDPTRRPSTKLAVPYRAKDSPSARSEFSHPDVVICLTCLSYYYGGMDDDDLALSLDHLIRSDQGDVEFQEWVKTSQDLPESFRHLKSINLKDKEKCRESVFPCLRYSKGVVDYFLSHIIFNKEMKEFPYKLSASGWDVGRSKTHPLTGFSGTNDSQHTLPVSVTQLELDRQRHTNALVLGHLMRPENSVISLADEGFEGICKSRDLLGLVIRMTPAVRVILDVGAQVLDMANQEFAQAWLLAASERGQDIHGAVFCSTDDEICVIDRRGHVELLSTSPFANQLNTCVVFLDEAHTRGIDLRLPEDYRAAVTLGSNLTKDRLVQACMRMRKLAAGQSIVFCVPEEIETKVREMSGKAASAHPTAAPMTIRDMLLWAIQGTWTDLRRSMVQWVTQGTTFARQKTMWDQAKDSNGQAFIHGDIAHQLQEDDALTLQVRYRPQPEDVDAHSEDAESEGDNSEEDGSEEADSEEGESEHNDNDEDKSKGDASKGDREILGQILHRRNQFQGLDTLSGSLQEEQERELAPEIEQERQLERPAPADPEAHRVHQDVEYFVKTGKILYTKSPKAFIPAFHVFKQTSAAKFFQVDKAPTGLLVTRDFGQTVKRKEAAGNLMDDYQRAVQWVLTDREPGNRISTMVVLSPFEANKLMSAIEKSTTVVLHLFAPRQNEAFRPLDNLTLYTVPEVMHDTIPVRLRTELMLFSGQLYFDSYEQYVTACDFLCLAHEASLSESSLVVGPGGFISPRSHGPDRDLATVFLETPIKFLKAVLTRMRRPGESIDKIHMGKVLEGALLIEEDFLPRD